MITVAFKRKFRRGALRGMIIDQTLRFATIEGANWWIDGVKKHKEIFDAKVQS